MPISSLPDARDVRTSSVVADDDYLPRATIRVCQATRSADERAFAVAGLHVWNSLREQAAIFLEDRVLQNDSNLLIEYIYFCLSATGCVYWHVIGKLIR